MPSIITVQLYIITISVKYYKIIIKKGKGLPITRYDGTKGEYRYSSIHS